MHSANAVVPILVTENVVPAFETVEGIIMLEGVEIEIVFPVTLASAPETVYIILSMAIHNIL